MKRTMVKNIPKNSLTNANSAIKLTAIPSIVYVAIATLPQHNQFHSRSLPRC